VKVGKCSPYMDFMKNSQLQFNPNSHSSFSKHLLFVAHCNTLAPVNKEPVQTTRNRPRSALSRISDLTRSVNPCRRYLRRPSPVYPWWQQKVSCSKPTFALYQGLPLSFLSFHSPFLFIASSFHHGPSNSLLDSWAAMYAHLQPSLCVKVHLTDSVSPYI
jgi:hypothetical protein